MSQAAARNQDDLPTTESSDQASPVTAGGAREEERVTCFFTGRRVPRSQAVQVRLGPGRKVWMLRVLCREG